MNERERERLAGMSNRGIEIFYACIWKGHPLLKSFQNIDGWQLGLKTRRRKTNSGNWNETNGQSLNHVFVMIGQPSDRVVCI